MTLAVSALAGFLAASLLGLSWLVALAWGATAVLVQRTILILQYSYYFRDREFSARQPLFLRPIIVVLGPNGPPHNPRPPWFLLIVWMIGSFAVSSIVVWTLRHPAHDGIRFDILTAASGEYSLMLKLPYGTRANQTVKVNAFIQRFLGSGAFPPTPPRLSSPDAAIDGPLEPAVRPRLDPAAFESREHSWTLRAGAGSHILAFDYGTPLFVAPPSVSGVALPTAVAIDDAAGRLEAMQSGARASWEVFTTLGISAFAAAMSALVGALVGGSLTLLGAYRK